MGVRLNAVEAQLDAMHKEFCNMKDVITDLQDRLTNPPPAATTAGTPQDGDQTGAGCDLFVPSDGTPWGDFLVDAQTQYESATPAEQEAADPSLEMAHVEVAMQTEAQFDVAAQKMFKILHTSRCQFPAGTPPAALARLMGVLASEALAALGYSHSEIEAGLGGCERGPTGSQDESGNRQAADGDGPSWGAEVTMEVESDALSEEPGVQTGSADVDKEPGVYVRQSMQSGTPEEQGVQPAPADVEQGMQAVETKSGASRNLSASADVLNSIQTSEPEDELEALIFMAQQLDARDSKLRFGGWPISLPKSWYYRDPKRAARCIVRAALAREPSQDDMHFRTDERRTNYRGEVHVQHRSTVRFKLWDNTFYGPPGASVAEAERAAFRVALDAYQDWIEWDEES